MLRRQTKISIKIVSIAIICSFLLAWAVYPEPTLRAPMLFGKNQTVQLDIKDIELGRDWRHDESGYWFRGFQRDKAYLSGGNMPVVLMEEDIPQPILESMGIKNIQVLVNYDAHLDTASYKKDEGLTIANSVTCVVAENPGIDFVVNFLPPGNDRIESGYSTLVLYKDGDGSYFIRDKYQRYVGVPYTPEDFYFDPENATVVREIKVFYAMKSDDLTKILREDIGGKKVYLKADLDCNRYLNLDEVRKRADAISQFNPAFCTMCTSVNPPNFYIEEVSALPYAYAMLERFGYQERLNPAIREILGIDIDQMGFSGIDRQTLIGISYEAIGLAQYLKISPSIIWQKALEFMNTKPGELKKEGFLGLLKSEMFGYFHVYRKSLEEGIKEDNLAKILEATDGLRKFILSPFEAHVENAIIFLNVAGSLRALSIITRLQKQEMGPTEIPLKLRDQLLEEGFLVDRVGVWLPKGEINECHYEVMFRRCGKPSIYIFSWYKGNDEVGIREANEGPIKKDLTFQSFGHEKAVEKVWLGPSSVLRVDCSQDAERFFTINDQRTIGTVLPREAKTIMHSL